MKSRFVDIDNAVKHHVANEIDIEKNKELEELIFFSSYTIKFDVFKKATNKLKKVLHQNLPHEMNMWEADALYVIQKYQLEIDYGSTRYTYLLRALLKGQIKINEAVMKHFVQLCKRAHSLEYIQGRVEQIYRLLFEEIGGIDMHKSSSSL